jgi:hypothetical protein
MRFHIVILITSVEFTVGYLDGLADIQLHGTSSLLGF